MAMDGRYSKIPVPPKFADKIAQDAVHNARTSMRGFNWSEESIQSMEPMSRNGQVGVRTSQKKVMYQEEGTRSRLMHEVDGKIVKIKNAGQPERFVRGAGVGLPGFVNIPGRGQVWRDQKWRHPGVRGRHFMQDAVDKAVNDNVSGIRRWLGATFAAMKKRSR